MIIKMLYGSLRLPFHVVDYKLKNHVWKMIPGTHCSTKHKMPSIH